MIDDTCDMVVSNVTSRNRKGGIGSLRCLHRWRPPRQSAAERLRGKMNMNTEPENTMTAGPSPPPKTNTLGWTLPPLDEKPDLFSPTEDLRDWDAKVAGTLGEVLHVALTKNCNLHTYRGQRWGVTRRAKAVQSALLSGDLDTDAVEAILRHYGEVVA